MDAELFLVTEYFMAFLRQYKAGDKLRESDLESWVGPCPDRIGHSVVVTKADVELEVAKLLGSGKLEKIERVADPIPDEAPASRRMPRVAEPAPEPHE